MLAADKEIVEDIFNVYREVQNNIKALNEALEKLNDEQKVLLTTLIFNYEQERLKNND